MTRNVTNRQNIVIVVKMIKFNQILPMYDMNDFPTKNDNFGDIVLSSLHSAPQLNGNELSLSKL